MAERHFAEGIGQAVAERSFAREGDGKYETWPEVAYRTSYGNALLAPPDDFQEEFDPLHQAMVSGAYIASGRHLQHGDENQPSRPQSVFANCATSALSYQQFELLLNGSGVGRSYNDSMMVVDWSKQPQIEHIIRQDHPDVLSGEIKDLKTESKFECYHHLVEDSREGWAEVVELIERTTFEANGFSSQLVFDWSDVRPRGAPIAGMQNRPSSGPGPLIEALKKIYTLRGRTDMERWEQTMHVDHYLAECVAVGGSRRSARISCKYWKDNTIFAFCAIKNNGGLWSSNNSILVDDEFWGYVNKPLHDRSKPMHQHAMELFKHAVTCQYESGSGEPGFINVDKLSFVPHQVEVPRDKLEAMVATAYNTQPYQVIVNPCVTADTWVDTVDGAKQVSELVGKSFLAVVNGNSHRSEKGFWKTGEKPVSRVQTDRGYFVRATDNHKVLIDRGSEREWVEVGNLMPGDNMVLSAGNATVDQSSDDFKNGWLLGEVVGDGCYNPEKYPTKVEFWGEHSKKMAERAKAQVLKLPEVGTPIKPTEDVGNGSVDWNGNRRFAVCSRRLDVLCEGLIEKKTKNPLPNLERQSNDFLAGYLMGFFDSDGCPQGDRKKGLSVRLPQVSMLKLESVQRILLRFGIGSKIYRDRSDAGKKPLPDGKGGTKLYDCQASHELCITRENLYLYRDLIGFSDPDKKARLEAMFKGAARKLYRDKFLSKVTSIKEDGVEDVYDCTVEDVHCFSANGLVVHNCGEIQLSALGGLCIIGSLVPYHAESFDDILSAAKAAARFLIRVNLMGDQIHEGEVSRTNRIGVGLTGLHEYAWNTFKLGWHDLLDENISKEFWLSLQKISETIEAEAISYSEHLGLEEPHSTVCTKPDGSTAKLFSLTEGIHLPAMREYIRWVQFQNDSPQLKEHIANGYPHKELKSYKGVTVVGFPTSPLICTLGMGDKLVTASEATIEEQYQWLRLLEKYWLRNDKGSQLSYTMKYDPDEYTLDDMMDIIRENQPTVKVCSMMPTVNETAYEYVPEEAVSKERYDEIVKGIDKPTKEDVGYEHVACEGGQCPITFKED